jgi:hypothetical protein
VCWIYSNENRGTRHRLSFRFVTTSNQQQQRNGKTYRPRRLDYALFIQI